MVTIEEWREKLVDGRKPLQRFLRLYSGELAELLSGYSYNPRLNSFVPAVLVEMKTGCGLYYPQGCDFQISERDLDFLEFDKDIVRTWRSELPPWFQSLPT